MIRLLKTTDALKFKELRLETLKLDPQAWLSTFDYEKDNPDIVFEHRISYWSNFEGFGYFGNFDSKDDLLAYILISPNSWPNKKHIVNMSDFAVALEARRKGVGSELVKGIVEIVKKMQGVEQSDSPRGKPRGIR
jgi:hypothetical protein